MATKTETPLRAFVEAFDALCKADPKIRDLWDNIHDIPPEDEIKTGPDEGARGGNVDKMYAEYSQEAPQQGIHKEYAEFFTKLFDKRFEAMKSQVDAVEESLGEIRNAVGILVKAHVQKAGDPVKAAAKEVEKALRNVGRVEAAIEAGTAEEGDLEKAELAVERARTKLEFHKAQLDGDVSDELIERYEAVQKAEADLEKANDSHDSSGKFSDKPGAKGSDKDKDEDEDDDEDKKDVQKADALAAQLTAAQTRLNELQEVVMNLSSANPKPPSVKTTPEDVATCAERVTVALTKGEITEDSAFAARRLISRWRAVEKGNLAKSTFEAELAAQKPEVRKLFVSDSAN